MAMISVNDLTFCYDGSYDNIFEHVSFQIDTDWKLGFTGRNGRGKTTFLSLLMGKHEYRGSISSPVSFDYFPFPVPDPDNLTADVIAEVAPRALVWQVKREFALLSLEEDALYRPFITLSHGERTKALLAALFLKQNNFLLIDEPTNHLDMQGRELVCRYLSGKKGFILVSHDRAFLDGCVDHILSINKADITVTKGDFSTWWENKARQDAFEQGENEKLMGQILHLGQAAARTANWSDQVEATKIGGGPCDRGAIGAKSAKMMKRAKAIEKRRQGAIEKKSKLLKNIERNENLAVHPLLHRKERLVELSGVTVEYASKTVLRNLRLGLARGERLALTGPNGCGKSTIVKLIAQAAGCELSGANRIPHTGTVLLPNDLVVSYVPQDSSFLQGDPLEFARRAGVDPSLFLTILRKLDFPRVQFEKHMADYSAGQRKKVLLAKSLCEKAHLYLWDEPLNYIDVLSRMQIEALIKEGGPTMLFVEHDRAFVQSIATRVEAL